MSTTLITILVAGWLLIGVAMSVVLGRRGHDGLSWLILGTILGPLTALLAIDVVRNDEDLAVETVAVPTAHAPMASAPTTGISVLVGFDSSPDAQAVIQTVIDLMGTRLRGLTLARVLPYDGGPDEEHAARTALVEEARRHPGVPIELEIIHGRPAQALLEAASAGQFDLLAVGALGNAHSHIFGTTAGALSQNAKVPVLICDSGLDPR